MLDKIITFLRNRSLVFKLSTSILLSVLIGSFMLSIFISHYSKPLLKEQVVAAAYKALGEVNHSIAQGADVTEQSLVNTAKILSLKTNANDEQLKLLTHAALDAIREQYGHFYEFVIFIPSEKGSGHGTLYHSYVKGGKINTVSWKEQDFIKDREWVNFAIQKGKIHWTEPYISIDPEGNKLLSTTVSVPFKFKGSTKFNGVIATSGNLSALREYMNSLEFESNGKYLLTSAKGTYLIHPDPNIEFKKTIFELANDIHSPQLKYAGEQVKKGQSGFVVMPKSSVYNSEVVFVYMPIPKTNWSSFLVYSSDNFYKPVKKFQLIMISVTIIGVLLLILLINWICKFTTNPIVELAHVADKYGKGDFSAQLPPIKSNDEVGILTQAFYNMKDNLLNLLKIQKENAKQEQKRQSELEIATKIQESVIPDNFPQTTSFKMYASMTPAKEVGGDFYDFFYIDKTHFAFLIADVSGKGIPAALFMMNAKSLLKSNLLSGHPLNIAINKTNHELCQTNNAGMFLTAFIAILNTETGEVEYVNAGHNKPLVKINNRYEYLTSDTNTAISAIDNFEYKSSSILLKPNENIFMYTDGVVEAQDTTETFYGEERLLNVINTEHLEPKETILKIKKDVDKFCKDAPQFDDITMICLNIQVKL